MTVGWSSFVGAECLGIGLPVGKLRPVGSREPPPPRGGARCRSALEDWSLLCKAPLAAAREIRARTETVGRSRFFRVGRPGGSFGVEAGSKRRSASLPRGRRPARAPAGRGLLRIAVFRSPLAESCGEKPSLRVPSGTGLLRGVAAAVMGRSRPRRADNDCFSHPSGPVGVPSGPGPGQPHGRLRYVVERRQRRVQLVVDGVRHPCPLLGFRHRRGQSAGLDAPCVRSSVALPPGIGRGRSAREDWF